MLDCFVNTYVNDVQSKMSKVDEMITKVNEKIVKGHVFLELTQNG